MPTRTVTLAASAAAAAVLLLNPTQTLGHSLPDPCDSSTKVGQACLLPAAAVRPTQLILGEQEVRAKTQEFSDMSVGDLEKYVVDNPVPCVAGPGGTFHATDHHHLTASVLASDHKSSDKNVVVLVQDTSLAESEDMGAFYEGMVKHGWVWLTDEKGHGPINPMLLPDSVGDLVNCPYRSLAYNVRKANGYTKVTTPYQDFLWGDFFRSHNLIPPSTSTSDFCTAAPFSTTCLGGVDAENKLIAAAQDAAMQLAASAAARDLPGYIGAGADDAVEEVPSKAQENEVYDNSGSSSSSSSSSAGAIVGVLMGVALIGTVIVAVAVRRRRGRNQQEKKAQRAVSLLDVAMATSVRYDAAESSV